MNLILPAQEKNDSCSSDGEYDEKYSTVFPFDWVHIFNENCKIMQ